MTHSAQSMSLQQQQQQQLLRHTPHGNGMRVVAPQRLNHNSQPHVPKHPGSNNMAQLRQQQAHPGHGIDGMLGSAALLSGASSSMTAVNSGSKSSSRESGNFAPYPQAASLNDGVAQASPWGPQLLMPPKNSPSSSGDARPLSSSGGQLQTNLSGKVGKMTGTTVTLGSGISAGSRSQSERAGQRQGLQQQLRQGLQHSRPAHQGVHDGSAILSSSNSVPPGMAAPGMVAPGVISSGNGCLPGIGGRGVGMGLLGPFEGMQIAVGDAGAASAVVRRHTGVPSHSNLAGFVGSASSVASSAVNNGNGAAAGSRSMFAHSLDAEVATTSNIGVTGGGGGGVDVGGSGSVAALGAGSSLGVALGESVGSGALLHSSMMGNPALQSSTTSLSGRPVAAVSRLPAASRLSGAVESSLISAQGATAASANIAKSGTAGSSSSAGMSGTVASLATSGNSSHSNGNSHVVNGRKSDGRRSGKGSDSSRVSVSTKKLIAWIAGIIQQHGGRIIGANLGSALAGSNSALYRSIKSQHGGLTPLLAKFPKTFLLENDPPFNHIAIAGFKPTPVRGTAAVGNDRSNSGPSSGSGGGNAGQSNSAPHSRGLGRDGYTRGRGGGGGRQSIEAQVARHTVAILSEGGGPTQQLKAVELANMLRARIGTDALASVREQHGGLLSLLERSPHLFRVSRIPKSDCVALVGGNAGVNTRRRGVSGGVDNRSQSGSGGGHHSAGSSSRSFAGHANGGATTHGQGGMQTTSHSSSSSSGGGRCLHVGNVASSMTDEELRRHFSQFGRIQVLKLVSQKDRRFAFVNFETAAEAERAKRELSKHTLWRSNVSFAKRETIAVSGMNHHSNHPSNSAGGSSAQGSAGDKKKRWHGRPRNYAPSRHLWIGCLYGSSRKHVLQVFSKFGAIEDVNFLKDRHCAFVDFVDIRSAACAFEQMQGTKLGEQRVELGFGRSRPGESARGHVDGGNSGGASSSHKNHDNHLATSHHAAQRHLSNAQHDHKNNGHNVRGHPHPPHLHFQHPRQSLQPQAPVRTTDENGWSVVVNKKHRSKGSDRSTVGLRPDGRLDAESLAQFLQVVLAETGRGGSRARDQAADEVARGGSKAAMPLDVLEWQMCRRYGNDARFLQALQAQEGGLSSFVKKRQNLFCMRSDPSGKPVVGLVQAASALLHLNRSNGTSGSQDSSSPNWGAAAVAAVVDAGVLTHLTSDRYTDAPSPSDPALRALLTAMLRDLGGNTTIQKLRSSLKHKLRSSKGIKRVTLRNFMQRQSSTFEVLGGGRVRLVNRR